MVGFGCGLGWLSMALPLLRSDKSPLETGKISVTDMSWIGSVISLGAIFGNCFFGLIVTIFGTRHTIFMIGFPQLVRSICTAELSNNSLNYAPIFKCSQVSWLFLMFGTSPLHLIISRFLSGTAVGGTQTCIFLYLAEIADNK